MRNLSLPPPLYRFPNRAPYPNAGSSAPAADGKQRRGHGYGASGPGGGSVLGTGAGSLSSPPLRTGGVHQNRPRPQQESRRFSVSFDEAKAARRRTIQEQVWLLVLVILWVNPLV